MDRRMLIAVFAVVVGAVAVAIGLQLLSGDEPPPSSGPSSLGASPSEVAPTGTASATPAASTAAPSPSEPAGPIQLAWEPATGLEPGASVQDVAFLDDRWIAVGSVFPEAAIWTSDDGRAWQRAEIDSTRAEDEVMNVTDLAQVEGAIVAIGSFGAMQSDQVAWVTWTSEDGGATWSEHRDGPSPHALRALASPGGALVGAGWDYAGTTPFDAWIAISDDGVTWERLPQVFEASEIHALALVGERLVAVGNTFVDSDHDATAWFAEGGGVEGWSRVAVPDAGASETLYDIAPVDGGGLAVGGGLETGAAAWLTVDGENWRRFEIVDGAEARAVAVLEDGAVAVGNVAGQEIGPPLAWTSLDGQTWETGHEIGSGSVRMLTVAAGGSVLVAGGECQTEACDTVLWIGEASR